MAEYLNRLSNVAVPAVVSERRDGPRSLQRETSETLNPIFPMYFRALRRLAGLDNALERLEFELVALRGYLKGVQRGEQAERLRRRADGIAPGSPIIALAACLLASAGRERMLEDLARETRALRNSLRVELDGSARRSAVSVEEAWRSEERSERFAKNSM